MAEKSNVGRPSKYDAKFCALLIEHMSKGLSFESFAGVIGVCRDTVFRWAKENPEFANAKGIGTMKSLLVWEQAGIDGLWDVIEYENGKPSYKKSLNTGVWYANMKNRFRWRDRVDQIQTVRVDPERAKGMSLDELKAEVARIINEPIGEE